MLVFSHKIGTTVLCIFFPLHGHTTFMKNNNILNRFLLCGFAGWSMECFWTGIHSIFTTNDKTLPCRSSMWMFPIYGLAAAIAPISNRLKKKSFIIRGGIYAFLIFLVEFLTGSILTFFHACPWNYSNSRFNYKGLIRFDFAPLWFTVGLLFEKIIKDSHKWSVYKAYFQSKPRNDKKT